MTAEDAPASDEWDWLEESGLRLMGALIFARDVSQDQVFEAFDLDPSSARMEAWAIDLDRPRVRVGQLGAWAFAIDEQMQSLHLALNGKDVGERLSTGSEVVAVSWTPKPTEDFEYWADGILVTRFEPYRAFDRSGSEPDRFLHEMRQVGMVTEANDVAEGPRGRSHRSPRPGDSGARYPASPSRSRWAQWLPSRWRPAPGTRDRSWFSRRRLLRRPESPAVRERFYSDSATCYAMRL